MIFTTLVLAAAAIVGVSAQDMTNLTAPCQAAFQSVAQGPASQCLALPEFFQVGLIPADQSVIPEVDKWLVSMCAQSPCTNDTLGSAVDEITTGCAADFQGWGVSAETLGHVKGMVLEWYPTVREVACLKEGDALCVTSTLKLFETYIGVPLSRNNLANLGPILAGLTEPPKTVLCTTCVQSAYKIIRPKLDADTQSWLDSYLNGLCGPTFTGGSKFRRSAKFRE